MAKIADVKVWRSEKGECRIYVHTVDGREGCRYMTGNNFHQPKTNDGQLTNEEWAEARKLALVDNRWTNYGTQQPVVRKNQRAQECATCGEMVAAGKGRLYSWFNDEEDRDEWLVEHLDKSICDAVISDRKAAQARMDAFKGAVQALRDLFRNVDCSAGEHVLTGVRMLDSQSIYGGGDWFVVEPDDVWFVVNNGMDGDDWLRNNVRTGGAGGIGRKLPRTDELVAALEATQAQLVALKAEGRMQQYNSGR